MKISARVVPSVLILAGGFIGAVLRLLVDVQIPGMFGTFAVNITGCFFLGILMYESIYIGAFSPNVRMFFGVGVIGAYTTFSTLAVQSFQGGPVIGLANIFANLVFGFIAVLAGRQVVSIHRGV